MEITEQKNEVSVIETALQSVNITEQVLARIKNDYLTLKIDGIGDKVGFDKVEDARKECKRLRSITKTICETGREDAIKIQKDWIEKQKSVIAEIQIVEDYLTEQSDFIKTEKERILFESAQRQLLPIRVEKLASIGKVVSEDELLKIDSDGFNQLFVKLHEEVLAEKQAIVDAELQKINEQKQAEEKAKQAIVDAENKAKEIAEASAKAIADAELKAKENLAILEAKAKADLVKAEQDRLDTIAKYEKEKQEAINKAEQDRLDDISKAEKAKQDAIEAELAKGDKDKFIDIIASLNAIKTQYTFKSKKHQALSNQTNELIDKVVKFIESKN